MSITQTAQILINDDFVENLKFSISSRNRWNYLNRTFDFSSQIFIGSCVILTFISGGLHIPAIALTAGTIGVIGQVCYTLSGYSKRQYESQTKIIEKMSEKVKAEDILVDETQTMQVQLNNDNITPSTTPIDHE